MAALFSSPCALVSPAGGRPRFLRFLAEAAVFQTHAARQGELLVQQFIWNFPRGLVPSANRTDCPDGGVEGELYFKSFKKKKTQNRIFLKIMVKST